MEYIRAQRGQEPYHLRSPVAEEQINATRKAQLEIIISGKRGKEPDVALRPFATLVLPPLLQCNAGIS
eukprot:2650969-Rhodomonas_salina.2